MKILVSTKQTQGARSSDFSFVDEGELLVFPMICESDGEQPDPDVGCGCSRSLAGMINHKMTTTFKVDDRPMTDADYIQLYLGAMQDAGYYSVTFSDDFTHDARELLKIAGQFEVGDVLEFRKDQFFKR